jgi:transposase
MDYQEAENLHPESTDSVELKKCLHAGVIPEAYEGILKDIEIVEVRRMIRDENALKAESPYGSEEEMRGIHRRCGLNHHPWSSSW